MIGLVSERPHKNDPTANSFEPSDTTTPLVHERSTPTSQRESEVSAYGLCVRYGIERNTYSPVTSTHPLITTSTRLEMSLHQSDLMSSLEQILGEVSCLPLRLVERSQDRGIEAVVLEAFDLARVVLAPERSVVGQGINPGSPQRLVGLREAVADAKIFAGLLVEEGEDPPDPTIWAWAVNRLEAIATRYDVSVPNLSPLERGRISAEWHDAGIDIELRFRRPGDVYLVLSDARRVVEAFEGRDPLLEKAYAALQEFAGRLLPST